MDKVFQEEQKKLAEIEKKIDAVASRYERKEKELQKEISEFVCVDYEDSMRLKELRQERDCACKSAEQFRSFESSPYFGRLDLDAEDKDESATFYIGEKGIAERSNVIVVDWRTPIGSCYYASNQKEFRVNGENYTLALKRALDIKNKTLIGYRTEYDGETVSLEGDVIDPFLLTVLKDKRRHNRLTDIIRTIQGNQNEIIRKPRTESFVVQGCAGSGKTMILLHRLSFLKFNNRNLSLSGVKIITPNKYFDAHINDLSVELGLTAIERFSVEEYYVSLIRRYSNKISVDATVLSEKTLSVDLLTEIYSLQYLLDSISHYHEYWNQVLSEIDGAKLKKFFEDFNIPYPNLASHSADSVVRLEQGLGKITAAFEAQEKKKKEILSRLQTTESYISTVQGEYDQALAKLENVLNQTVTRIEQEVVALSDDIQKSEQEKELLQKRREDLQKKRNEAEVKLEKYDIIIRLLSRDPKAYSDYDQFLRREDAVSRLIKSECREIIASIDENIKAYEKVPIYNFGKRNSLRQKLADSKVRFTHAVNQLIEERTREARAMQEPLRTTIDSLNETITSVDESIRATEKNCRYQKTRYFALSESLSLFRNSAFPDVHTGLSPAAYKECAPILAPYEEQTKTRNRIYRSLNSFVQTKQGLEIEQQKLSKSVFLAENVEYLENCNKAIKRLQFSEISRNVMFRDLLAKYRAYDQKYQKINYRHKLYLKLLYCFLYYSRQIGSDYFLNIDEAQDISVAEYHLLRMILGDQCVFNLYGDINQSVYSYKGISDWEEIANITGGNVYVLNENYRNTLQITEFCNKEFDAEVYPIGISGEPVVELETTSAIGWILDLKKQNPDYRVAILHRHGLKAVQEFLRTLLADQDVSWYAVDEKRLSVISVEMAKGLEFEAIVAIVDQMSNNEKYISYTRALDRLAVVRDNFSSELAVDVGTDEISDEFPENTDEFVGDSEDQGNTEPVQQLSSEHSPQIDDSTTIQTNGVQDGWGSGSTNKEEDGLEEQPSGSTEVQTLSPEESLLITEFNAALEDLFGAEHVLNIAQQQIVCSLYRGENVACSAPSGSMKSVVLYLLAWKEHRTNGKQTILTAEAYLQENELVLAERLGLKGGAIVGTMEEFMADFKKDKYDIIFVPYEFFGRQENVESFVKFFADRISFWGVDHPTSEKTFWPQINACCANLGATMYLMEKEGFADLNLQNFEFHEIRGNLDSGIINKQTFISSEERLNWVLSNLDKLYGQGLIYCDDEESCRKISQNLRRNRIMAEAYIDVRNPDKKERVNYLTNSFSSGGVPVLVTTQDIGKNLSNPNIRFIIHYDIPADEILYNLHTSQIGQLAENPMVYDLRVLQ